MNAAEAWARDGDDLEQNLRAEVAMLAASHKANDDAEYVARRDAHREEWRGKLRLVRGAYADSPEFRRGVLIEKTSSQGRDGGRSA